jgi:hypothetical protein
MKGRRKEKAMWVFDGEQWVLDNGGVETTTTSDSKPEVARQQWHELVPELQVIEIVPVPVKNTIVPPLPLP